MLTCIPCSGTKKDLLKEITNHIKGMSLKVGRVQKKRRRTRHEKEYLNTVVEEKEDNELQYPEAEAEAEAEEKNEWEAEPDPGVLITLVSLPNGENHIRRIRFREELFDAFEAQKWWSENYEKIMELYSIPQSQSPKTPPQSENNDQCQFGPTRERKSDEPVESSSSSQVEELVEANDNQIQGKVVEWVVEDEPGVFITVRSLPDGSNELIRVELSSTIVYEKLGDVEPISMLEAYLIDPIRAYQKSWTRI
uniref:BRX domain-containing protein n=1 Tax=Ananas comosus var. bracteatus TaxID=296719 RepID=A0A6V7NJE6_ANACO|nr:unnamed protein product [Ananas comosus var. bracteatus]